MRRHRFLVWFVGLVGIGVVLVAVLSASPVLADGLPQVIIVTVAQRDTQPDTGVLVQVKVFDSANQPVDVDQPDELLDVHDDSSALSPRWRPLMEQTGVGSYETTLSFPHVGMWTIFVAPDEGDVARIPPVVTVRVSAKGAVSVSQGSIVAVAALVVLGVLAVVLFGGRLRRARGARKAAPEPEAHDTWWW